MTLHENRTFVGQARNPDSSKDKKHKEGVDTCVRV